MLRAPLPTTLNYYLAIHSNDSFWTVQKDQASLSAVLPTTPRRPVQTGRLRISGNQRHDGQEKRARPTANRGQRSLLLPIAGGRRKKEEAATEPALAATSRKRPERCQTTLLRNGSRWVLLSTRRLWRHTKHYGVALGPACTIA